MTEDQKEEIIKKVSDRVIAAISEPIKQINVRLGSIQNSIDILSGDLEEDRKNLSQMAISASATEQAVRELVDSYGKTTGKIAAKVDEKVAETIETATAKVAAGVEPAMNRAVKKLNTGVPLSSPRGFWQKIKELFIK